MILGLDISTSKIGISVLDKEENILLCEVLRFDTTKWKGTDHELRVEEFAKRLKEIKKTYKIKEIIIEKPFISFKGGGSAVTTATLQSFNGMSRYAVYEIFKKIPFLVSPISARSKVGIKVSRKKGRKKLSIMEKKKPVIDYVYEKYKNSDTPFLYEMTRFGNPAAGTDDRADAIVLALYGLRS